MVSVCLLAGAQDIYKHFGKKPAAVCEVAALPKEMAEAKAKLEQEKKKKIIRQGDYLPNSDAKIIANVEKYIGPGERECVIKGGKDPYTIATPVLRITNTSHGLENVDYSDATFNVKKDRMSYAILRSGNAITIVNRKNKTCKMSDFTFTTESEAFKMNGNKIEFLVPTLNIAAGDYPADHKVTCVHNASGAKYIFDIHFDYRNSYSCSGEDGAYSFEMLGSDAYPDLALLCDLKTNKMEVVHLPFTFNASGYNGSNGHRGKNGSNGIDEKTWQDSDGKTHTIKGTCAKPGEDGQDGLDGQPGGTFLLCVSDTLVRHFGLEAITPYIEGGKGGKGGDPGKGGIHGKGSSCYSVDANGRPAKAADGKRGKDGKDGKRGDFLFVVADVNGFYLSMFGK